MIGVIGDAVCVEDAWPLVWLINGAGFVRGEVEWRWVKGVMEVSGEFRVHCSWCDPCSGFGNARLVMNFSGKIDYWEQSTNGTWSLSAADPSDNCYAYNFCGKFGCCNLNNNKLPCKCLPGFMPHVAQ